MNKIKLIGSIIVSIIIALVSVNNVEADVKNNKIVNYVIQNENLEFVKDGVLERKLLYKGRVVY